MRPLISKTKINEFTNQTYSTIHASEMVKEKRFFFLRFLLFFLVFGLREINLSFVSSGKIKTERSFVRKENTLMTV